MTDYDLISCTKEGFVSTVLKPMENRLHFYDTADNDTEPTGQTATSDRPRPTGRTGASDRSDRSNAEWLQQRIEHYRDKANDMCEAIEDLGDLDKLGQGFTLADPLDKVDIGDGSIPRPTFVNANLSDDCKADLIKLLKNMLIVLHGNTLRCLV